MRILNSNNQTVRILNITLDNITNKELLESLRSGILFTPNIDHFVMAQKDRTFYDAYRRADFVVLDSQVIFILLKFFGPKIQEKISGADFFPLFCRYHKDNHAVRIFVLGGMEDVSNIVQKKINDESGRKMVVGAFSPTMGFENDPQEMETVIQMIKSSGANVLAVGLGTPKQEKWIYRYKMHLETIDIFMGVGATFDFIAGAQKRAPKFVQKIGMEWLYRLVRNPKRLAKRYLVTDIVFIYYFIADIFKWYRDPFHGE
ncbi:MAG: WecB/TagA/CpsF family glycosyltransferase [Bacteroidota bacterium]